MSNNYYMPIIRPTGHLYPYTLCDHLNTIISNSSNAWAWHILLLISNMNMLKPTLHNNM